MVFFALSAYLFGMKWVKGDYEGFEAMNFMKKRCLRIYIPLWLTLPMVVAMEYLILHSINLKTILFNIVGLGWAKPFGIGGHLWYITLMMFLYLVFVVFSRLRLDKCRLRYCLVGYVALLAVYVLGESHFATFSSFSAGFCLFVCLLTLVKSSHNSRAVTHLADISYEVYLVHLPLLPFASYALKMIGLENSWGVVIIPWLVLTYVCAIGVHKTAQRIILDLNK